MSSSFSSSSQSSQRQYGEFTDTTYSTKPSLSGVQYRSSSLNAGLPRTSSGSNISSSYLPMPGASTSVFASQSSSAGVIPRSFNISHSVPSDVREALLILQESIRSQATELDIERNAREAGIRDLHSRTQIQISELREMIKQLRTENAGLKESLRLLERRSADNNTNNYQDSSAAASYYGAVGGSSYQLNHLPLIPRVKELEIELDRVRSVMEKMKCDDKDQRDQCKQLSLDLNSLRGELTETTKELVAREVDRREVQRTAAHQAQSDSLAALREELHKFIAQYDIQNKRDEERIEIQIRTLTENIEQFTGSSELGIKDQIEELKTTLKASLDKEKAMFEEGLSKLRTEHNQTLRKFEAERLESQQTMQTYIDQKLVADKALSVSREEFQRFQQQTMTSISKDVEVACRNSLTAKASTDDLRRDVFNRVVSVEAAIDSIKANNDRIGDWKDQIDQNTRKLTNEVVDLQNGVKIAQNNYVVQSELVQNIYTKVTEHTSNIEEISSSVSRLKSSQTAMATTDAGEKQSIKDKLNTLEDNADLLQKRIRSVEEALNQVKSQIENNKGSIKALQGVEQVEKDVVVNEQSLRKLQNSIDSFSQKVNNFEFKLETTEESLQTLREDIVNTVSGRIESSKQSAIAKAVEAVNPQLAELTQRVQQQETFVKQLSDLTSETSKLVKNLDSTLIKKVKIEEIVANLEKLIEGVSAKSDKSRKETLSQIDSLNQDLERIKEAEEEHKRQSATQINKLREAVASKSQVEDACARLGALEDALVVVREDVPKTAQAALSEFNKRSEETFATQVEVGELAAVVAQLADAVKTISTTEKTETFEAISAIDAAVSQIHNELVKCAEIASSYVHGKGLYGAGQQQVGGSGTIASSALESLPKSFSDVISFLLDSSFNNEQVTRRSLTDLSNIVEIVDRHEVGFSSLNELVQGIQFNANNICKIAGEIGLKADAFTLKVFEDGVLQIFKKADSRLTSPRKEVMPSSSTPS